MNRDDELSRKYKDPHYQPPKYRPPRAGPRDPLVLSPADKECYWKSLLSDPLCRNPKNRPLPPKS